MVGIVLAVKGGKKAINKVDELTAEGDPEYEQRKEQRRVVRKIPAILQNLWKKGTNKATPVEPAKPA